MAGAVIAALALALTGCGAADPTQARELANVSFQRVPGPPFGVAATRDGRYAFVDLVTGRVLVYSTSGPEPQLIRSIRVPGGAVGCSLTRDGRLLLVADGHGAAVVSVARAEQGAADPVLGTLSPPRTVHLRADGAIETASSADGSYVFVSLEYGSPGGAIAVYRIGSTSAPRFGPADYIGAITLGDAVVGSALSPNGRYLYVTSELSRAAGLARLRRDGTLSVLGVAAAEHHPAQAVLRTVPADLQPVRVAVSPNGSVVWVTARASDRLLAFSSAKLLSDPAAALLADVTVGTAPVGVALAGNGNRVIVADSDRFDAPHAHAAITIVNATAALAHRPAVIATVRAGIFPREIAVEPDGVALISNFSSEQLEAVRVAGPR